MGVFPPATPSFTSLPGLVAVNFHPRVFEQGYLASGAGQCFSSHRWAWAFLSPLQMALVLDIPGKTCFTLLAVFEYLLSFPLKKNPTKTPKPKTEVRKVVRTVKLMRRRNADLRFLVKVGLP